MSTYAQADAGIPALIPEATASVPAAVVLAGVIDFLDKRAPRFTGH